MWLTGLSARLRTKGSRVQFPVRAYAWVTGQVPSREHARGNHMLMFLFLPPLPSLKVITPCLLEDSPVSLHQRRNTVIQQLFPYSGFSDTSFLPGNPSLPSTPTIDLAPLLSRMSLQPVQEHIKVYLSFFGPSLHPPKMPVSYCRQEVTGVAASL